MCLLTKTALLIIFFADLVTTTSTNVRQVSRQTTSLALFSDREGYIYDMVQIGLQVFNITFDSGGWTSWITSTRSLAPCHQTKTKYDDSSPTRNSLERRYCLSYAHGELEGNVVTENVVLAGQKISNFLVVEMVRSTCPPMEPEEYDGVFGMRKPPRGDTYEDICNTTLIEYAVNAGLAREEIFTLHFCGPPGQNGDSWFERGELVLGGVQETYHFPPLVFTWLYESEPWRVLFDRIQYGDLLLCSPCRIIVDTGAPITTIPEKTAKKLCRQSPIKCLRNGALAVRRGQFTPLKSLRITVRSQTFTIPPEALLLPMPDGQRYRMQYGMQYAPGHETSIWIIGISLLHSFYTVFDQEGKQMGFAAVRC